MPQALESPIVVDFPLRGAGWMAVTTPAARIPSHGTDMLGQRYAYDFLKVDLRPGVHFHPASSARLLLLGGRTKDAYAWGEPIHSPVAGVVVGASDGTAERSRIYPMWEARRAFKNALTFRPSRLGAILGNHVYEVERNGRWVQVSNGVPGSRDRLGYEG